MNSPSGQTAYNYMMGGAFVLLALLGVLIYHSNLRAIYSLAVTPARLLVLREGFWCGPENTPASNSSSFPHSNHDRHDDSSLIMVCSIFFPFE
jgi:hypothetical protein